MGYLFDIEKVIKDSGLSEKIIGKIKKEVRQEFPKDDGMYELHLLRAIETERNKSLSPQKKLQQLKEKGDAVLKSSGYRAVETAKGKKKIIKSAA